MTEYSLAVLIFAMGTITSILLVAYIFINSMRFKREEQAKSGN
ncbi:hypothetical protein [uncultured Castellaniella sp.]|nr:hypothetical protein [uncultured Castellaniella sp.]